MRRSWPCWCRRRDCKIDAAAVRATARQRLAPFKAPKRIEVVDALPRNAMSKVDKAALRARFGGR